MNALRVAVMMCSLGLAGCATSHSARGLVLSVDPQSRQVTVSHEAIPGFMDAMVMPFVAQSSEDIADVLPGDRIAFRIRTRHGQTLIDRVTLLSAAARRRVQQAYWRCRRRATRRNTRLRIASCAGA
jgi:Cu/Ag efflux protein CusF